MSLMARSTRPPDGSTRCFIITAAVQSSPIFLSGLRRKTSVWRRFTPIRISTNPLKGTNPTSRAASAGVWGSVERRRRPLLCLIGISDSCCSRLETIFEVPTSRKNGSVSSFGQKRMKRFLEFSGVGEARKPKKPLVGPGKAGNSTSRTRRGGPKDAAPLSVQDVDSLLCTKLDQLNLWLIHDQSDESMPLQQAIGSL